MNIDNFYSEIENSLLLFKEGLIDLQPFTHIALNINNFIINKKVTYKDLSNEGKLCQHLVNVAILGGNLGILYGVKELYSLVLGCLLHDIGKMYIDNSIFNKNGKLTDIERLVVAEHTVIGYKIVSHYIGNKIVRNIVLQHHDVFNKIPLETEIVTLKDMDQYAILCGMADIADAILSYRPYKKPLHQKHF